MSGDDSTSDGSGVDRSTDGCDGGSYANHGDYVSKVARDTARLVADRFLTVPDGLRLIQEAARAKVP